jgi:cytosine/adenosine deaminase-related metal-dependent hydrolase
MHEAAKAHSYGVSQPISLMGVTSYPADAMGMGHRIGRIKEGYDADLVVSLFALNTKHDGLILDWFCLKRCGIGLRWNWERNH